MSRQVHHVLIESYIAAEALEANRLVILDPTNYDQVRYPEAQYDTQLVGITKYAAASGAPVDVVTMGNALLVVDGNAANILPGDSIAAHSTAGLGQKVTRSDGTTYYECIGFANEASTADGDEISVRIFMHVFPAA